MTTYEYKSTRLNHLLLSDVDNLLNTFAKTGWMLDYKDGTLFIFKRIVAKVKKKRIVKKYVK